MFDIRELLQQKESFEIYPNAFSYFWGQPVIAQYIYVDNLLLDSLDYKHYKNLSPSKVVTVEDGKIFDEYRQVTRLRKTKISDREVLELTRKIQKLIGELLSQRLDNVGKDAHLLYEEPLDIAQGIEKR